MIMKLHQVDVYISSVDERVDRFNSIQDIGRKEWVLDMVEHLVDGVQMEYIDSETGNVISDLLTAGKLDKRKKNGSS